METATSRATAAGLAALALALTGCGSTGDPASGSGSSATSSAAHAAVSPSQTIGLTLPGRPPPAGWATVGIPGGAAMAYPPGWQRIASDRGTASAALFDRRHRFVGFLNLTPRQKDETVSHWARFRVGHNAEEHDRNVRTLAVATGLRFRTGSGACVKDSYTTATGAQYIELACLVMAKRSGAVIVGASPPREWHQLSPVLKRAIAAVVA